MSWGRSLMRLLMKQARVAEVEPVAEGFRLITLESPEFKGLQWVPGQKVQIAMGSAFVARTFTPIEWDETAGRTRILGVAHGHGPGSAWVRDVSAGDACDVFGPRASLDVGEARMPVAIGDETSIGLAHALALGGTPRAAALPCLFEVKAVASAREVTARLHLDAAELFECKENDAHLEDIEQRLPALAATGSTFVLTGRASTIQRLRRALKDSGVPASRVLTKAYWAPGKTGLD
jgi:NADPH-dependent ferric siderophore reductase